MVIYHIINRLCLPQLVALLVALFICNIHGMFICLNSGTGRWDSNEKAVCIIETTVYQNI